MAAPIDIDPALDARLQAQAEAAAGRWDARSEVRARRGDAMARGDYLEADSRSRLAQRVNHLVQDVRRSTRGRRRPLGRKLRELVESSEPVAPGDLDNDLINEAVVGARDFLSVEFLERGLQAARAVGRVLVKSGAGVRPHGTGFLVAPGLLLTNQHVLTSATFAATCVVEMDYEQNFFGPPKQSQLFVLEPVRFFLNNADLDFALVAVAPHSDRRISIEDYGWLPLISAQGKIALTGHDYINIIQHPLGREKEVALRENKVLDLRTGDEGDARDMGPFIHYEADTERGSSGSPVLNDQWEVVALHHSGVPRRNEGGQWLDKDGNLWRRGAQPLSDVDWIANEGIRISSLVNAIEAAPVAAHEQALLERFLSAQPPSVIGVKTEAQGEGRDPAPSAGPGGAPRPAGGGSPQSGAASAGPTVQPDGSILVNIPVRIAVGAGGLAAAAAMPALAAADPVATAEALERMDPAEFADRRGFDRQFLGQKVPFPEIKPAPRFGRPLRIARPSREDDQYELRYHHYSVLMNAGRRQAYVSACNIDFAAPESASRSEGRTSWRLDPRIEPREQLGAAYYSHNDYDKGHLTRRDDAAWGRDKAEAIQANDDTFFYTNSAPQHFLYNQADDITGAGLNLWGDLENHISKRGGEQRARLSIFNGPVFGSADKKLIDAHVPLSFYKIVIWRDGDGAPGAIGFVLEQTELVRNLAEEAIDAGAFVLSQRRIEAIEALVDLDFGSVKQWDVTQAGSPEDGDERESIEAGDGFVIRTFADLKL
ncbi:MAG TPA: DNA/RNA non-specific endonuclease [Allosphingosinicella sp.]|jgi:endonuclease G